jgi:hypothetical protein
LELELAGSWSVAVARVTRRSHSGPAAKSERADPVECSGRAFRLLTSTILKTAL